ncbi:MAG: family 20 glycosylhydrolase [Bacteroidales bacterium]|nr:family 20 glycosylhydrolase [Bacteroidales bacterium]
MKTKQLFLLAIGILFLASCNPPSNKDINIIPQPANAYVKPGSFTIDSETRIITQTEQVEVVAICEYFNDFIEHAAGFRLEIVDDEDVQSFSGDIVITTYNADSTWDDETYKLDVSGSSSVVLQAKTPTGLFYGVQTILQMLPPEIVSKTVIEDIELEMPSVDVKDFPRFEWRGMHLDVCRHFFPKEFIKEYLDLMAMYKMNMFHWHLTEDQGWRIEIKKYPELTKVSAWRTEADGSVYGGYYTQDDIREIVEYARQRQITIVPEIEMPGHSVAALAAYPELSCTGGPFEVATIWGVKEDVYCAGNEKTFEFLENVLLEVMDLFPGEYIHIGGDECPKARWQHCSKCQARIRKEGLADEFELQSYFIKRIETFLNEHGRKLIGWDEILEGGLAPEATVMSWRGEEGGIKAALMGHDVVMTPNSHCYFDHYQADPSTQPKAIGGYTTLRDVYHYNPSPAELNDAEQEHILGAQGNVWTEYIATPEYAEYMAVPRMIALAEVDWSTERRIDWERFMRKLDFHFKRLDIMGVNYCDAVFAVEITLEYDQQNKSVMIQLESELEEAEIRYTLDGSEPGADAAVYDTLFELERSATVKACIFVDEEMKGHVSEREIKMHQGIGKAFSYKNDYSDKYTAGGDHGLVNGIRGSVHHNDGQWQGFRGDDVEVVIDLGSVSAIKSISVGFLQNMTTWIFMPSSVSFLVSDSDSDFKSVGEFLNSIPMEEKKAMVKNFSRNYTDLHARYVKIIAKNPGPCPDWHPGAGSPSWVFVDEIIIE